MTIADNPDAGGNRQPGPGTEKEWEPTEADMTIHLAGVDGLEAMQARAERLRSAAGIGPQESREAMAALAAELRSDAAIWAPVREEGWWRNASIEDVARYWAASTPWHEVDPRAMSVMQRLENEFSWQNVAYDIEQGERSDVLWLRKGLEHTEAQSRSNTALPAPEYSPADQQRMADELRQTFPAEQADALVDSGGWPAMAYAMHQLDREGADLASALGRLELDGGEHQAVLAQWQIETRTMVMQGGSYWPEPAKYEPSPQVEDALARVDQEPARRALFEFFDDRINSCTLRMIGTGEDRLNEYDWHNVNVFRSQLVDVRQELETSPDVLGTATAFSAELVSYLRKGPVGEFAHERAAILQGPIGELSRQRSAISAELDGKTPVKLRVSPDRTGVQTARTAEHRQRTHATRARRHPGRAGDNER